MTVFKDWDPGPLTRKFVNGCQARIQGQGHFTKCRLWWGMPPFKSKVFHNAYDASVHYDK